MESEINIIPTTRAEIPSLKFIDSKRPNNNTTKFTEPRTKFGIVFAAVERILVPNCSAAMVTKIAQYPVPVPNMKHMK